MKGFVLVLVLLYLWLISSLALACLEQVGLGVRTQGYYLKVAERKAKQRWGVYSKGR